MSIINVTGLAKSYGNVQALKGVSFGVERGEIFAMLGPNGSGKTTTLEILMGLRRYDTGKVEYLGPDGREIRSPKIGPVFQTRTYYDTLKVRELIRYYSGLYDAPSTGIQKYLDMVNLQDKLDTPYRHLSGGQQQQVAIVLALVNDPDILFFDEPTNALDPQVRLKIWDLIRTLKAEGKTIIFTTHYIEEAEALADRVAILSKGELVVTDTPANIIRRYNETFTVELGFEDEVGVDALGGFGFDDIRFVDGVYTFNADAIDAALIQAVATLSAKYRMTRVNIGKSSLESVFVKITEERFAS